MKPEPRWIMPLLLACVACGAAAGEEPDYKIALSNWSYSRERKTVNSSNRVIANFTLKNRTTASISGVHVTLTYASGLGEKIGEALKDNVGTIRNGESKKISITADFLPAFGSFTILVEYGGKKEEWYANSAESQPEYRSREPVKDAPSVLVLGREAATDAQGRLSGAVRVKNEGTVEAKNVKITVTFYDSNKRKMSEWSDKLGKGALAAGAEDTVKFSAAAPKGYASYELKVGCEDLPPEAALANTNFTDAEDVEFARFVFKRNTKTNELKVTTQVRNGFASPVDQVKLTLIFFGPKKKELKKFVYEMPEKVDPKEIKSVNFAITELPNYETFEQTVAYNKLSAPAAAAAPAKAEAPKFKMTKEVEVILAEATTNADKSVTLLGSMRNGKATPVKDVLIHVVFAKGEGEIRVDKTLTDVVQPGEERNFVIRAAEAAGYSNYTYKFTHAAAGLPGEEPAKEEPPGDAASK